MSLPDRDVLQVLRVPGRVAWGDFSTLAGEYPFGGEDLGHVSGVELRVSFRRLDLTGEDFGGAPVDSAEGGEEWSLALDLRQWNEAALSAIFPARGTSDNGRLSIERNVLSANYGQLASSRTNGLLFWPDRPTVHPSVFFPRAMPRVAETLALQLSLGRDARFPAIFTALPPASGGLVYRLGFRPQDGR